MRFTRALLTTTAAFVLGLAPCLALVPTSQATPSDVQRLDAEIERFDRDARALIPQTVSPALLGTWSCKGLSWTPASFMLTYRANGTGGYATSSDGKRVWKPFIFGTDGLDVIDYQKGEYPERLAFSFSNGTLTISGNSFWKEGDGWFATPELDKATCRRVTRAGK